MNFDKIIEFAPYIIVLVIFFFQNRVFVRPEELEKKHREILNSIANKYVEINAYKEFQNNIFSRLDDLRDSLDDLKETLMARRRND